MRVFNCVRSRYAYLNIIFWNERNTLTKYNKISLIIFPMANSIGLLVGLKMSILLR